MPIRGPQRIQTPDLSDQGNQIRSNSELYSRRSQRGCFSSIKPEVLSQQMKRAAYTHTFCFHLEDSGLSCPVHILSHTHSLTCVLLFVA